MVAPHFFRGALAQLRIRFLRLPGVESTDETVKLSHYVSAVLVFAVARPDTMEETAIATQPGSALLSFTPLPIGSPVKGSRQLCCRGVEFKHNSYQLSALRCGQRSLVGNGFIRSVCDGLAGSFRS